ncbi:hypothetical protein [Oceaniradius stylonematis]|uniref:hypothetical protein n=1 Tax=Oceaniradius stylonematis TaxID=2184161 RepID=UPI003B58DF5C
MLLSFESDIAQWTRYLDRSVARQVPFATAKALTDTARLDLKPAAERLIRKRLDRPTPFTQKGPAFSGARKHRLVATVFIKDIQAEYLRVQEQGGVQRPKGRAFLVPVGQRRNKYGNLPRNAVRNALAKPGTFSGRVGGVGGIWQRMKSGKLKLLVRYEDETSYQPRLGFHVEMAKVAGRAFPARFARSLQQAIRTAR